MVQSLCGHWLVLSIQATANSLGVRSPWAECGRFNLVDAPVLYEHLGLEQAVEAPSVEQLVAQAALNDSIQALPGRARVDESEPTPLKRDLSATA